MNIVTTKENFETETTQQQPVKLVRKAALARKILQQGGDAVRIVDIKMDNTDPDHKRSIFAFENTDKFQEIFSGVLEENRKEREESQKTESQRQIDELTKQLEDLKKMVGSANKEA